jgi:pimeloyl-ACP methyl ester carboxylesterase
MQVYGENLHRVVDVNGTSEKDSRFYDLISWDPRAVGNSVPKVDGMTDPALRRWFRSTLQDLGSSLDNEEVFNKAYDLSGLYGQVLTAPQPGTDENYHPAKFSGTTSVIRDMIEIIERHGEWREKAAKKVIAHKIKSFGQKLPQTLTDAILQRTAYQKGKEMLQFWGFSYGTIVGQTFASVYPERVGRLVLDGVVNATDYYAGAWKTDLIDAENINKNFTAECHSAGPQACALSKLLKKSSHSLHREFKNLMGDLQSHPVVGLVHEEPIFIDHFQIISSIFGGWYNGFLGYSAAGRVLWEIAQNNASYFYTPRPPYTCNDGPEVFVDPYTPQTLILCTDADDQTNSTNADYKAYLDGLKELSPTFFSALGRIMMPCHGIGIRPKWRFHGPFGAETANPILFASQTLDPVTPLISAEGASKLFPGSQVLEAQGIGHTTLGWPSVCAAKQIKEYFRTGKVPSEKTFCPASVKPFQGADSIIAQTMELEFEDRLLMQSVMDSSSKWSKNWDSENLHISEAEIILPESDVPDLEAAVWHDRIQVKSEDYSVERELIMAQYFG